MATPQLGYPARVNTTCTVPVRNYIQNTISSSTFEQKKLSFPWSMKIKARLNHIAKKMYIWSFGGGQLKQNEMQKKSSRLLSIKKSHSPSSIPLCLSPTQSQYCCKSPFLQPQMTIFGRGKLSAKSGRLPMVQKDLLVHWHLTFCKNSWVLINKERWIK